MHLLSVPDTVLDSSHNMNCDKYNPSLQKDLSLLNWTSKALITILSYGVLLEIKYRVLFEQIQIVHEEMWKIWYISGKACRDGDA